MLKANFLRCEYRVNPIGIFTATPSLSWVIESDKCNVIQQEYQIQFALNPAFSDLFYLLKEESPQSQHILYQGPALPSCTRLYWRVRLRDASDEQSDWSESAFFETPLLTQEEYQGIFISAEDENAGESSAGTLLRKNFHLTKSVKTARLYASAKGIYEAHCNGKRLGKQFLTPGWTEYKQRLLYQTYVLDNLLQVGENVIGAMIGPGWYKGDLASWLDQRNVYGKRTAFWAMLRIEYEDGSLEWLSSDETWRASQSPILYSEIYHGETYDASLEQLGWDKASFNDSAWTKAEKESSDLSALKPQDGLFVEEIKRFKPKAFFTTPQGDRVIDFGQNIAGFVRFQVQGKAGERVLLRHAETLDSEGNFYTKNLRKAKQRIEYRLKGEGLENYQPHFTFQGFRYISIDEYPGDINMENFEAIAISSAMRPMGDFSCSETLLNQLVSNVRWSMRDNFVDIPSDCPQRDERLGWTGDAQVFVRAASYLAETPPFFRKWLRDVSASQLPDGGIPHVVPNVLQNVCEKDPLITQNASSTGWGDVITVAPWTMYRYFGDKALLAEQYPAMKAWVDYIHGQARDGLLWDSGFHFGDWVALDAKEGSYLGATPNDLTASAYYAYSSTILAQAAQTLGKEEDARYYENLSERIKQAYQDAFFDESGRLKAQTQTAHILSLKFNLVSERLKEKTIEGLAALLANQDGHLQTGFLGTPYFCEVLGDNGRMDLAYDLLLKKDYPSWLYQVSKGATTVWEHWDGLKPDGSMWSEDMNSFNHYAYGAVVDWIFSNIGGLSPLSAGFSVFLLAPKPGGKLRFAQCAYESLYGAINLRWQLSDGNIEIQATIPCNTRAKLILPKASAGQYSGISFEQETTGASAMLGSGNYCFNYPFEA